MSIGFDADDIANIREGVKVDIAYTVLDSEGDIIFQTDFSADARHLAEVLEPHADPAPSPIQDWIDTPEVQTALKAGQIAWEGEHGLVTAEGGIILANGILETIIAFVGLPTHLDSLASREALYKLIRQGA